MKKTDTPTPGRHSDDACSMDASKSLPCDPNHDLPKGDTADDDFFRQVNIEFLVHELKAPVSIIETGVRLLLDKQRPEESLTAGQQRTLQRVLRNANKTRDMLAELLEIGRARNACFHCRPFHPCDVLRRILMEVIEAGDPDLFGQMKDASEGAAKFAFLAQKGVRLDASPAAETMTIEQDELKFSQIVGNLMKNGFAYRRRHLLIHAACRHDSFSIAVRDDGPGIAPVHHETIFQRYKQVVSCEGVARNGHGLGLAVARILARSMGGDIVVESELGQGAMFRLNLPIVFPIAANNR